MSTAQQLAGETSSGPLFWAADPPQLSIDPNGNLTQKTEGNDTWTYEWDAENRLKRVLKNAAEVARFAYDPLGRRVEKVIGTATTTYVYDRDDILREAVSGAVTTYIHGPGLDEPLAREDASGNRTYYHADGLASVIKETNSAGTVTLTRGYDAFGNLQAGATTSGYAFTGREWESEVALAYYRARWYDPKGGRFLSEDPYGIRSGINRYAYVDNNPVLLRDPKGLQATNGAGKKWQPSGPLNPAANTIVCDGKGGVKVRLADPANPKNKCIMDCVLNHEIVHRAQATSTTPGVCAGQPAGQPVAAATADYQHEVEYNAYTAEEDCLLKRCPCDVEAQQRRTDIVSPMRQLMRNE